MPVALTGNRLEEGSFGELAHSLPGAVTPANESMASQNQYLSLLGTQRGSVLSRIEYLKLKGHYFPVPVIA